MRINQAVHQFELHLGRRSPNTQRAYMRPVRMFAQYLREQGITGDADAGAINPEHVIGCARQFAASDLSDNSLASYLTGLRQFVRFLMLEDLMELDGRAIERLQERLRDVQGTAPHRSLPRLPSEQAVEALLAECDLLPQHTRRFTMIRLRNLATLHCLRATGARVSEIVSLNVDDLLQDRQAARVTGKGRKDRIVYFDDEAWRAVMTYITLRGDEIANGQPVLARHDRQAEGLEPMSTNAVREMIHGLAKRAGVQDTITPHQFRHRFGTRILTGTGNLAATQDLLGHSSPTTTRIYARLHDDDLAAAHAAASL